MWRRVSCALGLAAIAAVGATLASPPAHAADIAEREILGFSPDGRYFAFEEYGIEGGSHDPYSHVYVMRTADHKWAGSGPIRVKLPRGANSLEETRAEAREEARHMLSELGISEPGQLLASNPLGEINADPFHVTVRPRPRSAKSGPRVTFNLLEVDLPAPACRELTVEPIKGVRIEAGREGEPARLLDEDHSLSAARGCPIGYRLSDVVYFEPDGEEPVYVLLLSVLQPGYEGTDRRFVAGAYRLPALEN